MVISSCRVNRFGIASVSPSFDELEVPFNKITQIGHFSKSNRNPILFAGGDGGQVFLFGFHQRTGLVPLSKMMDTRGDEHANVPITAIEYLPVSRHSGILAIGHGSFGARYCLILARIDFHLIILFLN